MKNFRYCLIALLLFFLWPDSILAFEVLNIRKDFGAKGDGRHLDDEAFEKAATYINTKGGYCILEIPYGIYRVGQQRIVKGDHHTRHIGGSIFHLINCQQVTIRSSDKSPSIIRFKDDFYFGTFDEEGHIWQHAMPYTSTENLSEPGHLFFFEHCTQIQLEQFILDGNFIKGHVRLGGGFGDQGWQIYHNAVSISGCHSVQLDKLDIRDFGLDGIYIPDGTKIDISDCHIARCGRQGISWLGGEHLNVDHTTIEHIGQGLISSYPSAGIDIEPSETGCRFGQFSFLRIIDCAGECLVSDLSRNSCENMRFEHCTLSNFDHWSIWVKNKDFQFHNCTITGCVVNACSANNWSESTRFIHCRFLECSDHRTGYYNWLINMQQCTRVLFDSCEFRGFSKKLIHLTSPADKNTASRVAHCQFYYEGLPEALKKNLSGDNTIAEFGFCQLEDNLFYIDPNTLRIFGLPSCFDLLGTGAVIIPTVIRSPHDCH